MDRERPSAKQNGLTRAQLEVAREILTHPESIRTGAALSGGAAMIYLGLVNPRSTPDIDIHLPTFEKAEQLLTVIPQSLRDRGYVVRSHSLAQRMLLRSQRHITLNVLVPNGDVVSVGVGPHADDDVVKVELGGLATPRARIAVRVPLSSDLAPESLVALADPALIGRAEVAGGFVFLSTPRLLATADNPANVGALISHEDAASVVDPRQLVLVTNPRELVFRKVHSFLFKFARRKASDLVDVDGLLSRLGVEGVLAVLREGGRSRVLEETALRARLSRALAEGMRTYGIDDYPVPAEVVSEIHGRLKRVCHQLTREGLDHGPPSPPRSSPPPPDLGLRL